MDVWVSSCFLITGSHAIVSILVVEELRQQTWCWSTLTYLQEGLVTWLTLDQLWHPSPRMLPMLLIDKVVLWCWTWNHLVPAYLRIIQKVYDLWGTFAFPLGVCSFDNHSWSLRQMCQCCKSPVKPLTLHLRQASLGRNTWYMLLCFIARWIDILVPMISICLIWQ